MKLPWGVSLDQRSRWVRAGVLVAGLLATGGLLWQIRREQLAGFQLQFQGEANATASMLIDELDECGMAIDSLARFRQVAGGMNHEQFRAFVTPLLAERPEFKALEWIPRVDEAQRRGVEAQAGVGGFTLTERNAEGKPQVAATRAVYFPVFYVEPLAGNAAAVGYDLNSNPVRRQALEEARDSGGLVATGRVKLVQENGEQFGFLAFSPVFRLGAPLGTVAQRREALEGFGLGVFRAGDLLAKSRGIHPGLDVVAEFSDLSAAPSERFLHRIAMAPAGKPPFWSRLLPQGPVFVQDFEFAHRRWSLRVTPGPGYMAEHYPVGFWLTVPLGLVLTLALIYILSLQSHQQYAEELVRHRTAELSALNVDLAREIAEHRQTESLLSTLIDTLPTPFFFKDSEGRYRTCNRAFEIYRGKPAGELIGRTVLETGTDEMAAIYHQRDLDVIRNGECKVYETRERHGDGSMHDYVIRKARVTAPTGEVLGMAAVMLDITDRKQMEQELQEALELVRVMVDSAPTGILVFRAETGECVLANETAATFFGFAPGETGGLNLETCGLWASCGMRAAAREALAKNLVQWREAPSATPDGREFWLGMSVSCFRKGADVHVLAIVQDLSKRKQAEVALWQAQKLESLGLMAGGIAHEINTPTQFIGDNLAFLQESVQLLLEILETLERWRGEQGGSDMAALLARLEEMDLDFIATEVPMAIEQSREGVARVTKIVQAMKDFSHPGSSSFEAMDLNRSIESTLIVSRSEWKYIAELETDFDPALPPVPCYHDAINQAVLNLVVNAAHALEEAQARAGEDWKGRLRVRTRREGGHAVIEIEDNGTGIPEANRSRIFEPFFTTKPVGKGTGQGLAFVHSTVVEKHHGSIELDSRVGKGTTFTLRLPLEQRNGRADRTASAP